MNERKNIKTITINIRHDEKILPIHKELDCLTVYSFEQALPYIHEDLRSITLDLHRLPDNLIDYLDKLEPYITDECIDILILAPDGDGWYSIAEFKQYYPEVLRK